MSKKGAKNIALKGKNKETLWKSASDDTIMASNQKGQKVTEKTVKKGFFAGSKSKSEKKVDLLGSIWSYMTSGQEKAKKNAD